MPWENIGSVNTGDMPNDEAWILFCLDLAQKYVQFVCGLPPEESKLDVMRSEHELGDHPSLGVWYDMEEPCEYIIAAENALDAFNKAVSWTDLKEHSMQREEDTDDEDDCITSIWLIKH